MKQFLFFSSIVMSLLVPLHTKAQDVTAPAMAENKLLVYPHPVLSHTRIVIPDVSLDPIYVSVLNMNGRIEFTNMYPPGARILYLDMGILPSGTYMVQVSVLMLKQIF